MVSNQYVAVNIIGSEVLRTVEHHVVVLTGTEIYVCLKWKTKSDGGFADFFRHHNSLFSAFNKKLHVDSINKGPKVMHVLY